MKGRLAKVPYCVGNLGQALFFNSVQTFLIFFYTDVVRLDRGCFSIGACPSSLVRRWIVCSARSVATWPGCRCRC